MGRYSRVENWIDGIEKDAVVDDAESRRDDAVDVGLAGIRLVEDMENSREDAVGDFV